MKRKLISLLTAAAMVFAALPVVAENADVETAIDEQSAVLEVQSTSGTCGDKLTWELESGTLTISGTGNMINYGSSSSPWFKYRLSIKSVVIEDGVTSIGDYAFYGFNNVTSITISESVTSIGDYAFGGCNVLEELVLPNAITSIGNGAFNECRTLESIDLPDSLEYISPYGFGICSALKSINVREVNKNYCSVDGVLFDKSMSTLIRYPINKADTSYAIPDGVIEIVYDAFCDCDNLVSITIPDSVTSIGDYAFTSCSNVTSVSIGNSVTSIGAVSFGDCYKLKSINLPEGLTSISGSLFANCKSLTNITIPDSVTSIDYAAFSGCSSLTSITIPDSVTSIDYSAFSYCTSLVSVTIPDSITTIERVTFSNCKKLTNVTIGNGVTSIDDSAFSGCSSLTNITIPDSVTNIGSEMFSGCTALTNITIPDSVTSMGSKTFYNCTSLTDVTIGIGLTSISDYTFYGCTDLTNVSMTKNVTEVGESAFSGTDVFVVYYEGTEDDWNNISWGSDNDTIQNATVIYNGDPTEEIAIISGTCGDNISWMLNNYETLTISGTGDMPDYSDGSAPWFDYANNIKSIIVEDGITGIGDYAFYGLEAAKSVAIPNSVTSIGNYAFDACTVLGDLYIDDISSWLNIDFGDYTSNPMYYAKNVYVDNVLTTEIEIPSGTEAINYCVFYGYSTLTSVTIPKSVILISSAAFTDCDALTEIYYKGSESEWKQIIGYNYISSQITVYYAEEDTTPTVVPIQTPTVTQSETDDMWSFEVTLETTYANSTVFVAAYDANGALIGMSVTDLQIDGATTVLLKKYTDADIVKIFVWSDTTQPITTAWESEIV